MLAIIDERQLTPSQEEELELRESHPEKYDPEFDPDLEFKINKKAADVKKSSGYITYSREQIVLLMEASKSPPKHLVEKSNTVYPSLPREECERLMHEHYQYLEDQRLKKIERESKEKELWDSLKTKESDIKTATTTKPIKSLKDSKSSASPKKKS